MLTRTSTWSGLKDNQGNPVRLQVCDEIVLDIEKKPDMHCVRLSFRRPAGDGYEPILFSNGMTEKFLRLADLQTMSDLVLLIAETVGLSVKIWEHSFGQKVCVLF